MGTSAMRESRQQFVRYATVGLLSNGILFVLYLVLTAAGLPPIASMSVSFGVGVLQTFVANRVWTFGHRGPAQYTLGRYVATYAMGYLVNLVMLWALVDRFRLPHVPVQGTLILCIAILMFVMQKHWVFRTA